MQSRVLPVQRFPPTKISFALDESSAVLASAAIRATVFVAGELASPRPLRGGLPGYAEQLGKLRLRDPIRGIRGRDWFVWQCHWVSPVFVFDAKSPLEYLCQY